MIIQCDFDGTIIQNNLSVLIRENFARDGWQKTEDDYINGRITVEQSNRLQYVDIKESKARLQEFVREHIEVRPGFTQFVRYCRDSGISLVIVSSGLDFYIETVLAEIGLSDLELHCAQTSFGADGIIVSYRDPEGNLIDEGFKRKYLAWLKQRDTRLVYIGDGLSDLEAARLADHVLATGLLWRLIRGESISSHRFADFHDIEKEVRRLNSSRRG